MDISGEYDWEVLLLLKTGQTNCDELLGHRVFCRPRRSGERPRAFIVHASIVATVVESSYFDAAHVSRLGLGMQGKARALVVVHFPPGQSVQEFETTVVRWRYDGRDFSAKLVEAMGRDPWHGDGRHGRGVELCGLPAWPKQHEGALTCRQRRRESWPWEG